jgi:Asparaginase, N-terminal
MSIAFRLDLGLYYLGGAQLAYDHPHTDGPRNLLDAVRAAASPQARRMGVMVAFNGQLHGARDVQKLHTSPAVLRVECVRSIERPLEGRRPSSEWMSRSSSLPGALSIQSPLNYSVFVGSRAVFVLNAWSAMPNSRSNPSQCPDA